MSPKHVFMFSSVPISLKVQRQERQSLSKVRESRTSILPLHLLRDGSIGGGHFAFGLDYLFYVQPEPRRHARPVCRIGLVKMSDLDFLNALRH